MGLFYRRPLCFFAFLFVAFSLLGFLLDSNIVFFSFGILALLLLLLCIATFAIQRWKSKRIFCLMGILSLAVAVFSVGYSLLTVTLPLRRAERFEGDHVFVAEIVREEYRADDYARYSVNLLQVGEEPTEISAILACDSTAEFSPKDRICAKGELCSFPEKDRDGYLLSISLEENTDIYFQPLSKSFSLSEMLFSPSGIVILSDRCQSALRERMVALLGERSGSLAAAFFVGDRSALPSSAVRDFGRSGTSHLMAVSGLHFSILLGALDFLLRALSCPKKGRLVLVTLASFFFLFLTGFSMSACRSALMLYAVYLTFLFQEEVDSVTSLFCSFALIVLISPYAIVDLGLWMSFLATLGLLTLYPMISEKIPRSKNERWVLRSLLRLARGALMLILMTTIATLFLLPILWAFWGEISAVSLLANPILSPISTVFLVAIPIWLVLSFVPWLGAAVGILLSWLGEGILSTVHFFSRLPSATISLNYEFCRILIPFFAVAMTAGLVIRFRKKWVVLLPPIALILSFGICLWAVRVSDRTPMVRCISSQGRHDALWISDGDEVAICDLSGGSYHLYRTLLAETSATTAPEIRSLVLTHYHQGHLGTMEEVLQSEMVRTIYLPAPRGKEERSIAAGLWRSAIDAGSEVVFYEDGEIPLTERITAEISMDASDPFALALTLIGENDRLTYVSQAWLASCDDEEELGEILGTSSTVLVGVHGSSKKASAKLPERGNVERVVYCAEQANARLYVDGAEHYLSMPTVWWAIDLP